MKYILLAFFIYSCNAKPKVKTTKDFTDSLEIARMADSMTKETIRSVYKDVADSAGSWKSPVIVTNAKLVQEEYSNYKSIRLTYKNVSGKKIEAIRFRWYGLNAFGEPADMGGTLTSGLGGGYDDDGLANGKTKSGTWSILSRDAKKVTSAFANEVMFSDGTRWEFQN